MSENKLIIVNLINCVKKRKCIWDSTSEDYSKRHKLEIAWREVAEEIGKPESYCRDKWRNVRTGFLRSLKEIRPTGSAASSKKQFYLHDHLQFLTPSYTMRNDQKGNLSDLEQEQELSNESNNKTTTPPTYGNKKVFLEKDNSNIKPSETINCKKSKAGSSRRRQKKRQKNKDNVDTLLLNYLIESKNEMYGTSEAESSWISFFKGLIPDILPLSYDKQRKLKKIIIYAIDEMHENDEYEVEKREPSRTFFNRF